jgi:hypothetical protein
MTEQVEWLVAEMAVYDVPVEAEIPDALQSVIADTWMLWMA